MSGIVGFFIDRVTFHAIDPETAGVLDGVSVWDITADASVREAHGFKVFAPKHPVFKGIPVADNVKAEPDELHIVAYFSPIAVRIDQVVTKARDLATDGDPASIRQSFEDFAKKGFLWTIDTSLKIYKNMLLHTGDVERNKEKGNVVEMSLRFVEARKASVSFANAKVRSPTKKANAAKVNQAAKATPTATGPTSTAALNIAKGLGVAR